MSTLSSEAAKNPCVPLEQNGLVVTERVIQTGVNVSVPKLKIESLKGQIVFLIGDKDTIEPFAKAFSDERRKTDNPSWFFIVNQKVYDYYWKDHSITVCYRTILDIPHEYRSKGIVICFDEPSYNGRQCLYHLFGSGIAALSQEACAKFSAKPYQAFTQLMEGTQDENKSAIVFVPKALQNKDLKEVMWCPAKLEKSKLTPTTHCPPIPQKELEKLFSTPKNNTFVDGFGAVYPVDKLPSILKDWISSEFPGTTYVSLDGSLKSIPNGMRCEIRGWNELPKPFRILNPSRWWSTFDTVFETKSSFKEFIDTAVENAKARKNIYTKEIAYTILKMPNPPSTILFDAPLVDTTQRGYRRISSNELKEETLYRDCDVLVGFIADTDATFDLVLDNDGVWDSPVLTVVPFRMKAGEFCLAWRDKGVLPSVRMVYHHMWVQNLQGSVRRVGMLMGDTDERRKFVQADEFPLDSDGWVSSSGMIEKKK